LLPIALEKIVVRLGIFIDASNVRSTETTSLWRFDEIFSD